MMFRDLKKSTSRITAVVLSVVMLLTVIPFGTLINAFAVTVDSYTVTLTDGSSAINLDGVEITLTNKADASKSSVQNTSNGVAIFENFVEEEETYTVSVAEKTGYESVADFEITPASGENNYDVTYVAIPEIELQGTVIDENGAPYKGATVEVTGYITETAVTGDDGKYSFTAYKGKDYTVTATAKEEKYEKVSTEITNLSETQPASELKFKVKEFNISTAATDSNGTISESGNVKYGESKTITATANDGYCIDSFKVDDVEQPNATSKKEFTYSFSNITDSHSVSVSFKVQKYKISFTVDENGKVEYTEGSKREEVGGSVKIDKEFNESEDPLNPTKVIVDAIPNDTYRVSKIVVDGAEQTFTENDKKVEGTEFIMTKDHTFVVEFSRNQYSVKINNGKNGTATVDNEIVEYNGAATVTIIPDDGYEISSLKLNGVEVDPEGEDFAQSYTLYVDNITANQTIDIEYALIQSSTVFDKIDNDYYTITFNKDGDTFNPVIIGNKYIVPDGTIIQVHPKAPYVRTSINYNVKYTASVSTIKQPITIDEIDVDKDNKIGGWNRIKNINIEIIFDTKSPSIPKITKEPDKDFNNYEYTISAAVTDDIAGVDKVYYSATNDFSTAAEAEFNSETNTAQFKTDSAENNYEYFIWAVDKVGNLTAGDDVKSIPVAIDKSEPTIDKFDFSSSSLNVCEFGTFSNENIKVLITASDTKSETTNSGIASITFNGQTVEAKDFKDGKAEFTLNANDFSATKEVSATATDNAGNVSQTTIPTSENSNIKSNKITISNVKATIVSERKYDAKYINGEEYWYDGDTDFTVKVTDEFGIQSVVIKMNGVEVLNKNYNNSANAVKEKEYTVNTSENPNDGKNEISVEVVNVNNNSSSDNKSLYIDTTAPDVVAFNITKVGETPLDKVLNILTFGIFFNEKVEITVTANDKNATSGIDSITLYAGEESLGTENVNKDNKATFTVPTEDITDEAKYFDKVLSAVATDNVGNITENRVEPTTDNSDILNSNLMIETVKPTVSVEYIAAANEKNTDTADENDWYNKDIDFNIKINDADSGIRNVSVKINGADIVLDKDNKNIDAKFYEKDEKTTDLTFTVNTNQATRNEDGSYTIEISVTDNAGNVSEPYKKTIYKDTDNPYITKFDFEPENFAEGSNTDLKLEVTDYGFYFKEDTKVTISSRDDKPSSGIKSITYYTVDKDSKNSAEITAPVNADGQVSFIIKANFKGQIYAKATDNVDNVQENFVNPNSAIIEDETKHREEEHIAFEKDSTANKTQSGSELYKNDVPVTITVTDTYSGIREIEWSVVAPYDKDSNQSGKVTVDNKKTFTDDSDSGWRQTKTEANLVTEMEKTITVNNNSNDIVVKVKMTDRAGNTSEKSISFCIDKTKPTIEVTYDNNTPDEKYTNIYKANRTATIKVTERNFDSKNIVYNITNTDGVIPKLSDWKEYKNTDNPDETYYIASIAYTADGDYTFDISYSDRAGNAADKFAQHKFTIDKTKPIVTVSYDNNSASNGIYYKADRTATITIVEHNFDAERVAILESAPSISAWKSVGDTHTATISYKTDGKYTLDIEFTDMAGNSIDDFAAQNFYIDKTNPVLSISGIADKSANNDSGNIGFTVTATDDNFDVFVPVLSAVIMKDGKFESQNLTIGNTEDIEKGKRYTVTNINTDGIYSITCTVTDKAGNAYSEVILENANGKNYVEKRSGSDKLVTFSVNRGGSVFSPNAFTENLLKTYYVKNITENVTLIEINADPILENTVTLNGKKLVENTDYTVTADNSAGSWYKYSYSINKALFEGESEYIVVISSKDKAGNEAFSDVKGISAKFVVDRTAPIVTVAGIKTNGRYQVEKQVVTVVPTDDGGSLKSLIVRTVDKNGAVIKELINLSGEDLVNAIAAGNITFELSEGLYQNVQIICEDYAGNISGAKTDEIYSNVSISSSAIMIFWANKPLRWGSIAGVILLTAAIIFAVIRKKRKEE